MSTTDLRVLVLAGGLSYERDVSLKSGRRVIDALRTAGIDAQQRDPETLARPWAVPGTPGLAHRIGGLEKADRTGDISYDPANHEFMVRLRQARIDGIRVPDLEVDDPTGDADVLVLGWGSTYGPIGAAL